MDLCILVFFSVLHTQESVISDKPQNNALITNPLCYYENQRFLKTPIIILANVDGGQGTHCSKHCPLYSVFFAIDNAILFSCAHSS